MYESESIPFLVSQHELLITFSVYEGSQFMYIELH